MEAPTPARIAVVLCVALALSGASLREVPPPTPAPGTPIYSGLAESLINACARGTATLPAQTTTLVTSQSWTWTTAAEGVRASLWQPRSTVIVGTAIPTAIQDRSAREVGACMDSLPLDWSVARSDSTPQRRLLYPYYRDVLIPCLRRHTGATPQLPSRADFLAGGLQRFDPYREVHVYSADTARRLQAVCPPAPRSVLVPAALIDAAGRPR